MFIPWDHWGPKNSSFVKIFLTFLSNYTYKNCDFIRGVEEEYTKTLSNKYDFSL